MNGAVIYCLVAGNKYFWTITKCGAREKLRGNDKVLGRTEKASAGVVLTINNLNFNLIIYAHIFNTTEFFSWMRTDQECGRCGRIVKIYSFWEH